MVNIYGAKDFLLHHGFLPDLAGNTDVQIVSRLFFLPVKLSALSAKQALFRYHKTFNNEGIKKCMEILKFP